tara:strand:- start:193 stop:579 length:387 start_codon:yes stop_codon:yes gene_type:complete
MLKKIDQLKSKNKQIKSLHLKLDRAEAKIRKFEVQDKVPIKKILEELSKKDNIIEKLNNLLEVAKTVAAENKIIISSQHEEIKDLNEKIKELQLLTREELFKAQINTLKEERFELYKKIHNLEEKIKK